MADHARLKVYWAARRPWGGRRFGSDRRVAAFAPCQDLGLFFRPAGWDEWSHRLADRFDGYITKHSLCALFPADRPAIRTPIVDRFSWNPLSVC
jgi:hypothetical protein